MSILEGKGPTASLENLKDKYISKRLRINVVPKCFVIIVQYIVGPINLLTKSLSFLKWFLWVLTDENNHAAWKACLRLQKCFHASPNLFRRINLSSCQQPQWIVCNKREMLFQKTAKYIYFFWIVCDPFLSKSGACQPCNAISKLPLQVPKGLFVWQPALASCPDDQLLHCPLPVQVNTAWRI